MWLWRGASPHVTGAVSMRERWVMLNRLQRRLQTLRENRHALRTQRRRSLPLAPDRRFRPAGGPGISISRMCIRTSSDCCRPANDPWSFSNAHRSSSSTSPSARGTMFPLPATCALRRSKSLSPTAIATASITSTSAAPASRRLPIKGGATPPSPPGADSIFIHVLLSLALCYRFPTRTSRSPCGS